MPDPTADPVATYLAAVRERSHRPLGTSAGALDISSDAVCCLMESAADVPRLLAALDAALALHQPEPGQHPDFCGADLRETPCPTVRAISAELLGEEQ